MSDAPITSRQAAHIQVGVSVVTDERVLDNDLVTVEEPLEIQVVFGPADKRSEQSLSVTMRTPGNDLELVLGFLVGEAIIASADHVVSIEPCGPPSLDKGLINVIRVELSTTTEFDAERLSRYTYTSSSCGVCGKASLDAVRLAIPRRTQEPFSISADLLKTLG